MAVVNTYFKKKEEHRMLYKGEERCTQVDYILCRRCKPERNCKVKLAGESVVKQHRMVVYRMALEVQGNRKRMRTETKIRWWKLKEEECCM